MAKVPYDDLPIRIFLPMTPGDVCLALIGDGPVLFKGATPLAVRKAASDWREAELAKMRAKSLRAAKDGAE